ncbi:MAG: hypothetical protein KDD47_23035, partial [Acidobacteria bacterium]|nr:hypothetical protein [Acidobacteriota bacterium]
AQGEVVVVGEWRLEVLHPPEEAASLSENDGSLVLSATARGLTVLLTGDLETKGEVQLLRGAHDRLRADVLKVGHHGSRSSTDPRFLRAVSPRLALLSAGRANRFGHPHATVLDRLGRQGTRTLRTDQGGAIHLTIRPGGQLRIRRPGGD